MQNVPISIQCSFTHTGHHVFSGSSTMKREGYTTFTSSYTHGPFPCLQINMHTDREHSLQPLCCSLSHSHLGLIRYSVLVLQPYVTGASAMCNPICTVITITYVFHGPTTQVSLNTSLQKFGSHAPKLYEREEYAQCLSDVLCAGVLV